MMRWCLSLCMLFCVVLPGFLSAQERWLRGKVVSVDEHEQKRPEVNITVTMLETGDADNTNSLGLFRIFLKTIFKPGEKVTLVIDKPDWRIRYPLEGEARIPAELAKELVEVQLLPVGSKLFWTHDRIEKFITDVAEKSKQTRAHLCFQAADPQLWAATLIGIGLANWELGTRTEGSPLHATSAPQ